MRAFAVWDSSAVAPRRDEFLAYVDPGNQAVMGSFRSEGDAWRRRVLELTMPCAELAGPSCGRSAVAGDAFVMATLANAAHGRGALYMPMDAARVAQRMTRAPDAYTWHDVLMGTQAMVGVWASGDETATYTPDAAPVRRRLWVVLDYGWDSPDGADEIVALLRAHAARAHAGGASHLTLYNSPAPRWTVFCHRMPTSARRSACRRRWRSRTTPMACIQTRSVSEWSVPARLSREPRPRCGWSTLRPAASRGRSRR